MCRTLTGPAIGGDGETMGAGAVVRAHHIVACMRTRVSNITFILICNNRNFTFKVFLFSVTDLKIKVTSTVKPRGDQDEAIRTLVTAITCRQHIEGI